MAELRLIHGEAPPAPQFVERQDGLQLLIDIHAAAEHIMAGAVPTRSWEKSLPGYDDPQVTYLPQIGLNLRRYNEGSYFLDEVMQAETSQTTPRHRLEPLAWRPVKYIERHYLVDDIAFRFYELHMRHHRTRIEKVAQRIAMTAISLELGTTGYVRASFVQSRGIFKPQQRYVAPEDYEAIERMHAQFAQLLPMPGRENRESY